MMVTKISSVLSLMGVSSVAHAFWRMECRGVSGVARADPIVDPNVLSGHSHTIHGSSGFNLGATYDDLVAGNCSSCAVAHDKSAYWTPNMYFHDTDSGEFTPVEQVGGMLAYYLQRGENVKGFPKDFRMIAGSTNRRSYTVGDPESPDPPQSTWGSLGQTGQADLEQRAVGFNCMNYAKTPEGSLYRHYLPDKAYLDANCPDGLRLEMMFPSCWNGKDTDSDDHKSHVAYPDLVGDGTCPEGYSTRLVTLFYETIWATGDSAFSGKNGEFVISNGDPTGFGYHADFMMGWDPDYLQEAVDTCTNASGELSDCGTFMNSGGLQSEAEQQQCKFEMPELAVKENVLAGKMLSLPGGVQVQYGPEDATAGGSSDPTPISSASSSKTASTTYSAPTLTYSPGSSAAIYAASADATGAAFIEAVATTSSVNAAAITPAPEAADPNVSYEIVSTQTISSGAEVEEIVWKEPVLYVTEESTTTVTASPAATAASKRSLRRDHFRRHLHNHGR